MTTRERLALERGEYRETIKRKDKQINRLQDKIADAVDLLIKLRAIAKANEDPTAQVVITKMIAHLETDVT